MAGFDDIPCHLRELMRATGNVNDAAYLWAFGVRTFEQAERFVANAAAHRVLPEG